MLVPGLQDFIGLLDFYDVSRFGTFSCKEIVIHHVKPVIKYNMPFLIMKHPSQIKTSLSFFRRGLLTILTSAW